MDRSRLFKKLDIETPEDFKYYENFDALIEEDEHIEVELIREILSYADAEFLSEHIDSFFDGFINNLPDDETEMYIVIDSFRKNISSHVFDNMSHDNIAELASDIYAFRKWYVLEHNSINRDNGEAISVRDARYEIAAAGFLGEEVSIDFGPAVTSGPDSYGIRLSELVGME